MDCHWYINCILLFSASGEGNGNPLQYSCLENATDRGSWHAAVHGASKSQTRLVTEHTPSKVQAGFPTYYLGNCLCKWLMTWPQLVAGTWRGRVLPVSGQSAPRRQSLGLESRLSHFPHCRAHPSAPTHQAHLISIGVLARVGPWSCRRTSHRIRHRPLGCGRGVIKQAWVRCCGINNPPHGINRV